MTIVLVGLVSIGVDAARGLPGAIGVPATALLALVALSFTLAGAQHAAHQLRRGPIVRPGVGRARLVWQLWRALAETAVLRETQVLLGLIFVLVCGPTWLATRLFGTQLLPRLPKSASTYWTPRDALTPESLRRQF